MKPPPLCKNKYVSYFKYQTTHENSYMGVMKKGKTDISNFIFPFDNYQHILSCQTDDNDIFLLTTCFAYTEK